MVTLQYFKCVSVSVLKCLHHPIWQSRVETIHCKKLCHQASQPSTGVKRFNSRPKPTRELQEGFAGAPFEKPLDHQDIALPDRRGSVTTPTLKPGQQLLQVLLVQLLVERPYLDLDVIGHLLGKCTGLLCRTTGQQDRNDALIIPCYVQTIKCPLPM